MDAEFHNHKGVCHDFSILLELAAADDLVGFRNAVEEEGFDIDDVRLWYCRGIGSRKMGIEERTPLMVASMFGSKNVLKYILGTGRVDVNRVCGSDGATALHCATAGGSPVIVELVELLLDASADADMVDACGNRPGDLMTPVLKSTFSSLNSMSETCLVVDEVVDEAERMQKNGSLTVQTTKDGVEKKEYPVDLSMPDIKLGIYGTDEFRMYTFKVKPCSRAYSHDWTECPFLHPGENARRRDPRKYHYSCVPCPEFRRGSCRQGDGCEYAHGIFECWLHPAQYRTRLCKDETDCNRRVCFFAHKPEELRPLYASTGSAVPSPTSFSTNGSSLNMGSFGPLLLGSPAMLMPTTSTPPVTPSGVSSPMGIKSWLNQSNVVPPTLQLPGSRLKASVSARNMDFDMELFELESQRRWQQLSMDEMSDLSSPSHWNNAFSNASAFTSAGARTNDFNRLGGIKPTNLEDIFGSLDPSVVPQVQGLLLDASTSKLQSPSGVQVHQNMNQPFRSSYSTGLPSSPVRTSQFINASVATASPALNSRLAAFSKRSQSFVERSTVSRQSGISPSIPLPAGSSALSDWGSPDGRLDWGVQGNKLRKSASFGLRSSTSPPEPYIASMKVDTDEPNASWVHSKANNNIPTKSGQFVSEEQQYQINTEGSNMIPAWVEPLYREQEQMVA